MYLIYLILQNLCFNINIVNYSIIFRMKDEKEFNFPDSGDLQFLQWQNNSPNFRWFYTPHRCLFIFAFLMLFILIQPENSLNKLFTFWFFCSFIIATCVQDSPLVRPHPFFWRLVLGFTLVLIFTILGGCYLGRSTVRQFLINVTPNAAGDIPPDRNYSMSCSIYDKLEPNDPFHNVKSIVYDEFMTAHFFGWVCKSILLRDTQMCWILSFSFEIVERLLKSWFPNFNECWWDSLILDVLLCNGFGIFLGMKFVNYLIVVPWETRLLCECRTNEEKLARMLKQFTPRSYVKFEWKPLLSVKRYFVWLFVMLFILCYEVNLFALKMVLKMTTKNVFLFVLIVIQVLIGAPSIFEMYLYATNVQNTIGSYAEADIVLILSLSLLVWRSRDGYFQQPLPMFAKIVAITAIVVMLGFPVLWFGVLKKGKEKNKKD